MFRAKEENNHMVVATPTMAGRSVMAGQNLAERWLLKNIYIKTDC